MNTFLWSRFKRLLINDLQIHGTKILMGSAAALLVGLLIYLTIASSLDADVSVSIYRELFSIGLMAGGLAVTSRIFNDMHHPLQQYLYLMPPVSNFERLFSRYLISGPLFYLYFVGFYWLFDSISGQV